MPISRSQFSRVKRRNPLTLRAQHPGDGSGHVGVDQTLAVLVGTEQPDAVLLELAHRPRQIRHRDDRNGFGGPARRLGDGRIDADGAILRHDHGLRAERVGAAQAGAEIVRIGDPV